MGKSLRKISRGMEKNQYFHPSQTELVEAYKLGKDMGNVEGQDKGAKRQREQDNKLLNEWFAQLTSVPGIGKKLSKRVQQNFNEYAGGWK